MVNKLAFGAGVLVLLLALGFFINYQQASAAVSALRRPPQYVTYTFIVKPMPSALPTATVVTIDGVAYTPSQLPAYEEFSYDTRHSYQFASNIATANPNANYVFNSTLITGGSACGGGGVYGRYYVTHNCTITARYNYVSSNAITTTAHSNSTSNTI